MDINPEDETFYVPHYQQAFLRNVENPYFTNHRCLLVDKPEIVPSNNLVLSTMASESSQSSFDLNALSSDDEENFIPNNVAETTPGWCDRAVRL